MAVNKNPEWVTRGKVISGLIKELETFENKDLKMFISLDDSFSVHPIIAALNLDDKCILLCDYGHSNSLISFVEENYRSKNIDILSEGECSIQELINILSRVDNSHLNIIISDGVVYKPISLVGKGGGGKFAELTNCE